MFIISCENLKKRFICRKACIFNDNMGVVSGFSHPKTVRQSRIRQGSQKQTTDWQPCRETDVTTDRWTDRSTNTQERQVNTEGVQTSDIHLRHAVAGSPFRKTDRKTDDWQTKVKEEWMLVTWMCRTWWMRWIPGLRGISRKVSPDFTADLWPIYELPFLPKPPSQG